MTLLNVLGVLGVLNALNVLNVLNVLHVLHRRIVGLLGLGFFFTRSNTNQNASLADAFHIAGVAISKDLLDFYLTSASK